MSIPEPQLGMVVSYSYLWFREFMEGREEGAKDRPAVVVLSTEIDDGDIMVRVAPVTTKHPGDPRTYIEIPALTKKRLGLDETPCFLVLTEGNRFLWPGPDIRPVSPGRFSYGLLPAKLFKTMITQMRALAIEGRLDWSGRTE